MTLVPDHWTLDKTANEFGTTIYYARKARSSLENEGVFGEVKVNQSNNLSNDIIEKVELFYNSDEVGRMMPGVKDTVSIKINGVRDKVQKRLLYLSLKELYITFKQ